MKRSTKRLAGMLVLAATLVACGDDGGGQGGIASLGADFQAAFGQARTDAPVDVTMANLVQTPFAEPFDI